MTPTRLTLADQLIETVEVLAERPWRALAGSAAVVLGVGAAIATLTVSQTAQHQVTADFDALRATQVNVITQLDPSLISAEDIIFPANASQRLGQLNGVVAAGVIAPIEPQATIASNTLDDLAAENATTGELIAIGPGALDAAELELQGGTWSSWHERRNVRVALVGANLASNLSLNVPDPGQVVYVNGIPFALAGTIHSAVREPRLLNSVVVTQSTAEELWPRSVAEPPHLLVRVEPGAAALISQQAPIVLRPDAPGLLSASAPPDPGGLRQRIESSVRGLFLAVAVITLTVGAISIGVSTMMSVLERRAEFALRRTVGARPSHIVRQVLSDTTAVGLIGGGIGTVLALVGTLLLAVQRDWVPIIDPRLIVTGPILGGLIGGLAGAPAAYRAARIDPASAIRG